MITISSKGEFKDTTAFLEHMSKGQIFKALDKYGQIGVSALTSATPKDTGDTAHSWSYEVLKQGSTYSIIWNNDNVVDGRPIAILIQYGHATGKGGYVQGRDYINPALRAVFDQIANDVWQEVTNA
jgi:Bacteriophage HK97-gp10, putative tail-component